MKVSVCMASFNGASHIFKQINSILLQLKDEDELIVVDDCSSDQTIEIIRGFRDNRISLYQNSVNMGPARTFDKALGIADGEVVFLSDQDDLWLEGKVETILQYFGSSEVDLIVHDARVVNGGRLVSESLFDLINSTPSLIRNIISSSHTGCCMALRRSALSELLPIPNKRGIYHDSWIGTLSGCLGQKKVFLPLALIEYSRHDSNASTLKRRSYTVILPDRFRLISTLLYRLVKKKFFEKSNWIFSVNHR